ncbi:hypothetical protein [Stetteria hydrogenophila]
MGLERALRRVLPSLDFMVRGLAAAFIAVLTAAAVALALGREDAADTLAVYAYYILAAAVALALVDAARSGGDGGEGEGDGQG